MISTFANSTPFRQRIKSALPWVRPRPLSGNIWLDCAYIALIASFQLAIIPTFLPGRMTVDILTPWLVIGFIRGSLARTLITGTFAAVLLETYSAIPAGLYICSYFIIGVSVFLYRRSLSWRVALPWFASFLFAEVIVVAFESFIIYLADMQSVMTPVYILVQAARIILAIAFGLFMVDRKWMADEEEQK